jgi:Coenzyme PQQ synthesis protein D (PqqD)
MAAHGVDSGTALTRAPDVIAVHVGEVLVLHDPLGDAYVRLNKSGELLWECLAEPRSVRELAGVLAERYGLPPERTLGDAERLVRDLLARGMVAIA